MCGESHRNNRPFQMRVYGNRLGFCFPIVGRHEKKPSCRPANKQTAKKTERRNQEPRALTDSVRDVGLVLRVTISQK